MNRLFSSTHKEAELFEAFFDSGMEESVSPFLTPASRGWGKAIRLKSSFIAAGCLAIAFGLLWKPYLQPLSQLALLMTYFFAGVPALISAIEDLCDLEINIDVLMILAAFLSLFIGSGYEGGLLLVLFSFSNSLEKLVSSKAKQAIRALKSLSPSRAHVLMPDGSVIERSIKDLSPGTEILVKAGQIIPLDGVVIEGNSSVNLVHLTGENIPIARGVGDVVQAGASNLEGALTLRITHTSTESTLSRIIQLIHEAQETKPTLQRWFDHIINKYAIAVILFSFAFASIVPFFSSIPFLGKEGSIYRALAFLIAASPCALILAIPIAYLSAMSACARKGIVLKGGVALDAIARCKLIALDKTGTLTEGILDCVKLDSPDPSIVLPIAYGMEQNVEHPIAQAVCRFATQQNMRPAKLDTFRSVPGSGLEGTYQGMTVKMGQPDWICSFLSKSAQIDIKNKIENAKKEGEALALLLIGNDISLFHFKDHLRVGVKETIQALQRNHRIRAVMLTGDHIESAERIAREAGISEIHADLKPEDKLKLIETLSQNGKGLAMVGDGVNDAPALARATVGIAMGGVGTQMASEVADVILLNDRFEHLDWLFSKASATTRIVTQNICLAMGAILVAVLPALLGFLPLWIAVLLHEGGTVIVGLNALRLLRRK